MLASAIPTRFNIPFANSAGAGYIRAIPQASQIGIQNGAASLTDGFPPWCFTPPGYPFGEDYNGLLKQMTQWNQWQGAGGPVAYDATFSSNIGGYPKGAVLAAANFGFNWVSTADNNTSDPDTGGANWLAFTPLPLYATDAGTANAVSITIPQTVASLAQLTGQTFSVLKIASANTAAVTMAVNTYSGSLVRADGTALSAGELPASVRYIAFCDGTKFILQSTNPTQQQMQLGNYAADTGTANVYACTLSPPLTAHVIGMPIRVKIAHNNTGASTFNPGPSAIAVRKRTSAGLEPLTGSELIATSVQEFVYDGTYYQASTVPALPATWFSGQQSFTRGAVSGPFSIGGKVSNANLISGVLICTSADIGFSIGDLIGIPGPSSGDDGSGCTAYIRSGSLYFSVSSNGIELIRPDTNVRATLTESKWQALFCVQGTN